MDNRTDPVREFLGSVRGARIIQDRCKRKVDEINAQCQNLTARMSGMPGGGSGDKHMDGLWAALADQRTIYLLQYAEAERTAAAVELFLRDIPEPLHRSILSLRYVDLLDWPDVVEELKKSKVYYSERQIYRFHGDALQAARLLWAEQHPTKEFTNEDCDSKTEDLQEVEDYGHHMGAIPS